MKVHTYSLLSALLRLARAAVTALEAWVRAEYDGNKPPAETHSAIDKR